MRKISIFLATVGCLILALATQAQTITPDASGIVYVNKTASGSGAGNSWTDAANELADALLAAAGNTAITQIWVAEGTYCPLYNADGYDASASTFPNTPGGNNNAFVLVPNVKLYGGFAAPLPTGSVPAFGAAGRDGETVLSGDLDKDDIPGDLVTNKSDNCNHTVISAGNVGTASLDGFTVTGGKGSGFTDITVNGVTVYDNEGGGIFNYNSSPSLANVTVSGNSAASGGGMLNFNNSSPALTNVNINGNSATYGGGMMNFINSSPALTNVTISGNSAYYNGGGMLNSNYSSPVLTDVTISGNSADYSGGIQNENNSSPALTNVTISGNSANNDGGGMMNYISSSPDIQNSIIHGNTATTGANVHNNNTSGACTPVYSYSIVEGSSGGWGSFGTDGGNNMDADPLFVNWIDPSSATMPNMLGDYRLQAGSPAIDAGDNALYLTARGISDFTDETDLSGNPRLSGTHIDMGAYETPIYPVTWNSLTANGTSGSVTTTALTLTFDVDPTSLATGNITVTGATKGALSGTGLTRTLAISSITVADGANVNVAITNPSGFTITPSNMNVAVNVAPVIPPGITGPTAMTLTEGYAATSSGTFTVTGTPAPSVTKTSGDAAITWNGATMRLDIDAGLPAGSYPVELTASNGITPDASHTFTLTVTNPVYYSIQINASGGGSVNADRMSAYPGETVTLTLTPNTGYTLTSITVISRDGMHSVSTTGTGNTRTFTMPAANVTVTAYFVNPTYQAAWEAAKAIIEAADFSVLQKEANTQAELRYRLAEMINELLKNNSTFSILHSPFAISPYDIVIFDYNFRPAIAGDADNPQGVNGYFEFRVTPPETRSSAYNDGTITATSYNDVANEQLTMNNEQLKAWVHNGVLYVKGLTPGKPWYIYNLYGQLIYTGIAGGDVTVEIRLSVKGLYIIQSGNGTTKVMINDLAL